MNFNILFFFLGLFLCAEQEIERLKTKIYLKQELIRRLNKMYELTDEEMRMAEVNNPVVIEYALRPEQALLLMNHN